MSLFLSRLKLDPSSRRVASEVAHPYEMHRTILRAFPGIGDASGKTESRFGVLFRVERGRVRTPVTVLVQSKQEPDWSCLHSLGGYLDSGPSSTECRSLDRALSSIRDGQVLAFRLRANPTRRLGRTGGAMAGKRVELFREEDLIAWLVRKGEGGGNTGKGGFELVQCAAGNGPVQSFFRMTVTCEGKVVSRKTESGTGHLMTHNSVLFEGLLEVTDRDAFVGTLTAGIGSAKSFGFGLMTVAPAGV